MKSLVSLLVSLALAAVVFATPAAAYTGPGAGITALGSLLALASALALGVVGFVWYPVKRLLGIAKRRKPGQPGPTTSA